jgi:hypothetical protein
MPLGNHGFESHHQAHVNPNLRIAATTPSSTAITKSPS